MDSQLRLRIDIGLILLAALVGTTSVTGYGAADMPTVAAAMVAAILPTAIVIFAGTRSIEM